MVVRDGMKGVLVEMLALLLMVMIEIIIEGEKMIWICFGERILRGRE